MKYRKPLLIALLFSTLGLVALKTAESKDSGFSIHAELYNGCVKGHLAALSEKFENNRELEAYLKQLDINCVDWTKVWFSELVEFDDLSTLETFQYNQLRKLVIDHVRSELKKSPFMPKK